MNGYEALLKKILGRNGWEFDRPGKGSHEIWKKDGCLPQTIPHGCKSRYLANKILQAAGVSDRF
jgi:predicted RNA binding protein YcfA (HicA-like mRNA interferase family)